MSACRAGMSLSSAIRIRQFSSMDGTVLQEYRIPVPVFQKRELWYLAFHLWRWLAPLIASDQEIAEHYPRTVW